MKFNLARRVAAEFIGTAFLLACVIGSGIMGERLAGGNAGIALLANSVAVGAGLFALISTFGAISGAHFNPLVTVAAAFFGGLKWRDAGFYSAAQFAGAFAGAAAANLMFELPVFFAATKIRAGNAQWLSEFLATFGLLLMIFVGVRLRAAHLPFTVAAYVVAAFWFTASTAFANPAVTLARTMSDTFAGIRLTDAPAFLAAQIGGAAAAVLLVRWLAPIDSTEK